MISLFLLFALITGLGLWAQNFLKLTLPLTPIVLLPLITLLIYLGLVFNHPADAYRLVIFLSLIGGLSYLWKLYRQSARPNSILILISLFCCAWFWAISHGMCYQVYDSFFFWGFRGHQLFITQSLPQTGDLATHLEYPLANPIWQYFVFHSLRVWSMPWGLWAQYGLTFAPLTTVFLFRPWQKGLILFSISLLIILFFDKHALRSMLVDDPLATWSAGILLAFYGLRSRPDLSQNLLFLIPAFALLVLLKPDGIFFALFSFSIISLETFTSLKPFSFQPKIYFQLLILLLALLFTKFLWNLYVHLHHFDITLDFSKHADSFNTWDLLFHPNTLHQTINHIFLRGILWDGRIGRARTTALILTVLWLGFWFYLQQRKKKSNLLSLPSQSLLGLILLFQLIYFASLWFIYSAVFTTQEALNLASYSRYGSSYFMAIYLFTLPLILSSFNYDTRKAQSLSVVLFGLLILGLMIFKNKNPDNYLEFQKVQHFMTAQKINPHQDKIIFLWDKEDPEQVSPRLLFNLIYYPERFNTPIFNCEKIQISPITQSNQCEFTAQDFWKIAHQNANIILIVSTQAELLSKLGLNNNDPNKIKIIKLIK